MWGARENTGRYSKEFNLIILIRSTKLMNKKENNNFLLKSQKNLELK